jgi:hypothetical protein
MARAQMCRTLNGSGLISHAMQEEGVEARQGKGDSDLTGPCPAGSLDLNPSKMMACPDPGRETVCPSSPYYLRLC